ncbi:DUF6301 family protein [Nocardia goodfellowii]
MRVDIEGAVQIARLAKDFDWTGYVDDLPRFSQLAGWEPSWSSGSGVTYRTGMELLRPEALAFKRKRIFADISVYVTDIIDDSVPWEESRKLVIDAFADLGNALTEEMGIPVRTVPGLHPQLGWDYPNISINLRGSSGAISLELANPRY